MRTLAIFLLFFSILPNSFADFSDVNKDTQFAEAILYAQENGIVEGYNDGTFKPEIKINRAEFTKIIIESVFEEDEITGEDCFPDVQKEWFAEYICTAKKEGIISGYDDGFFRPENDISFVEAAKIIVLGFDYKIENNAEVWYEPFLKILSDKNAIPTTITDIAKKITRGEMVEIIYRLKENWYKPEPGTTWQWQLNGEINTNYDVDMYDIDLAETPQNIIDELHLKGKKVICYFSAGKDCWIQKLGYRDESWSAVI